MHSSSAKVVFNGCNCCIAANLVLHRTIERIHVGKKYGDIPRGVFIVRGENVVLLGEVVSVNCNAFFLLYYQFFVRSPGLICDWCWNRFLQLSGHQGLFVICVGAGSFYTRVARAYL